MKTQTPKSSKLAKPKYTKAQIVKTQIPKTLKKNENPNAPEKYTRR